MRDLLITLIILGLLPVIFFRPYVGILLWSWISYMNPHRLSWGFAYDFPFAMVGGVATIFAWLISPEPKRLPLNGITVVLIVFSFWISLTTVFAVVPEEAYWLWDRSIKVLLMTFLTIAVMVTRERLHALVWIIVASIGFFGAKGGAFTVLGGAENRVWGPAGSFIEDNNALALALLMVLPLMRYLQLQSSVRWVRWGLGGAMLLSVASIIGSYSRGALVAGAVVAVTLALKSRRRVLLIAGMVMIAVIGSPFIPGKWYERMGTIQSYEEDQSATERIQAWTFAYRFALDQPILGGGFGVHNNEKLYFRYAPDADRIRNLHSVYFEMLAYHGFPGLALFLILLVVTWRCGSWVIRKTRGRPDLAWARDLASMTQVGLIAYAAAGAFQNLAFFDLYYHLVAIMLLTKLIVAREIQMEDVRHEQATVGKVARAVSSSPYR